MWVDGINSQNHPRHGVSISQGGLYICMHRLIKLNSVNCRLPQTPRSPSVAASHYFDDIFSRSGRPRKDGHRPTVRRSSTSRSIGARSDFAPSVNGDAEEPDTPTAEEDEMTREHVSNYVESQLDRVRRNASMGTYEDEFETQADGEN